ncbi:MAG: cytochrome c3 family protein [candidate division KSB1 bacterium]|nr:cytochrome c3 family protein [candidate division KSB1 bacterium]MDZ7304385.1 cytochrome c3 family protein [candidate division KSB1 bacterium]MDZ7313534.1 cytochrome c3 family protein [candidate division KSB1 bacterium]
MSYHKLFEKQKANCKRQTGNGRTFSIELLFAFCFLPFVVLHAQTLQESSCVACHKLLDGELLAPVTARGNDIHAQNGFGCESCHGGNPSPKVAEDADAAMSRAAGYIGKPARKNIPLLCGKCHSDPALIKKYNPALPTDQLAAYRTSQHGERLFGKGDEKVAVCSDCHGYHGILAANDSRSSVYPLNVPGTCGRCHANSEYMAAYPIGTQQVADYDSSVHGQALLRKRDLAAPACNDCHGNHGAIPPEVKNISHVCGRCHLNNADLFEKSPHAAVFEEAGLAQCEACHGNHKIIKPTEAMLDPAGQFTCAQCHEPGSEGWKNGAGMYEVLLDLMTKIRRADSLVSRAERTGMEVSEAKFVISSADDELIKARTQIHTFQAAKLKEKAQAGIEMATQAVELGRAALAELQFRRKGLAVSMVIIFAVAAALYMKIRRRDREWKEERGETPI